MKALNGLLLVAIASAVTTFSARADKCAVAAHLVHADAGLARVAQVVEKARTLTIVVIGTTSSSLPSAEGTKLAYPARLEVALREKLPGVTVKVVPYIMPRKAALEMSQNFGPMLKKEQPNLVVWQTGTFDAMSGISADAFQVALEQGVETLREGGADVIFVNMQYSPRTEAVLASQAYAEAIRWVALEAGLNVFDRLAIMRHWSELGTFDLLAGTKSLDTASQVHNCIGVLLADLVTDAIKLSETESKESK
jgi:hypothetical protein